MKRSVNLRLEENIIVTLNQMAKELHTTKTDVIEKAITLFFKQNNIEQNKLLQFAGALKASDADNMLINIKNDKNSKDFKMDI